MVHHITDQSFKEWLLDRLKINPPVKKDSVKIHDIFFRKNEWVIYEGGDRIRSLTNTHGSFTTSCNCIPKIPCFVAGNYHHILNSFQSGDPHKQGQSNWPVKLKITFPVIKSYSSENYALMLIDSAGVTHYWNFDGSYDGFSSDPHIDGESGACLN